MNPLNCRPTEEEFDEMLKNARSKSPTIGYIAKCDEKPDIIKSWGGFEIVDKA